MCDCLFCKIIAGEIPSTKVYEDDYFYAFRDIHPVAPTHVLIVPRRHFCDITDPALDGAGAEMLAHLPAAARKIAGQEGLSNGFRLINNCGADGGQTVMHLHFHLIGGLELGEKLI